MSCDSMSDKGHMTKRKALPERHDPNELIEMGGNEQSRKNTDNSHASDKKYRESKLLELAPPTLVPPRREMEGLEGAFSDAAVGAEAESLPPPPLLSGGLESTQPGAFPVRGGPRELNDTRALHPSPSRASTSRSGPPLLTAELVDPDGDADELRRRTQDLEERVGRLLERDRRVEPAILVAVETESRPAKTSRRRWTLVAVGGILCVAAIAAGVAIALSQKEEPGSSCQEPLISERFCQIGQDIYGVAAGDMFGESMALSADGTIIAAGAQGSRANGDGSGQVRCFRHERGHWVPYGQDLVGDAVDDGFGIRLALSADGNTLAVGAWQLPSNQPCYAQVFHFYDELWTQVGETVLGDAAGDNSGFSIALSADGTMLAVGAPQFATQDGRGYARVYELSFNTWVPVGQYIRGVSEQNFLGESVSLSGDGKIMAVGADGRGPDGTSPGYVQIFQHHESAWLQFGQTILGEATEDQFGISVSLSSGGLKLGIGGRLNDRYGLNAGHVRVYQFNNTNETWSQMGSDIWGSAKGDLFGISVSLSSDGTVLAAGATGNARNGQDAGHIRLFEFVADHWEPIGGAIDGMVEGERFGISVDLSADGRIVGAGGWYNDKKGAKTGAIRIFQTVQ